MIIHKKFKTITFIYIHPKMGNLNEDDKGDKDFDNMLSNYLDELKNKTIKKIDLKKFPKSD